MFDQYNKRVDDWLINYLADLSAEEQTQLEHLLTKLNHHVDDVNRHDMMPDTIGLTANGGRGWAPHF